MSKRFFSIQFQLWVAVTKGPVIKDNTSYTNRHHLLSVHAVPGTVLRTDIHFTFTITPRRRHGHFMDEQAEAQRN